LTEVLDSREPVRKKVPVEPTAATAYQAAPSTEERTIRRNSLGLAGLALVLVLGGCENVPPQLERVYLRFGASARAEHVAVQEEHSSGPYPGLSGAIGTLLAVEGSRADAIEAELQWFPDLGPGGDLDGDGVEFTAGWRRYWFMDGRIRPSFALGAGWLRFHVKDHEPELDPAGPLGYGDVALDYMITPKHGIGLRLRGTVRYEMADHENTIRPGGELQLQSTWRF
jgi:hypothetical protein